MSKKQLLLKMILQRRVKAQQEIKNGLFEEL